MSRLIKIDAFVEVDEDDDSSAVFEAAEYLNDEVTLIAGNKHVRYALITDVDRQRAIYEKKSLEHDNN